MPCAKKYSRIIKHQNFRFVEYLQLSNAIVKAVEIGELKDDDMLPSINELSYKLEISRDTVQASEYGINPAEFRKLNSQNTVQGPHNLPL